MRVQGDILIGGPMEEVFDYVADERNEPRCNPQMTKAEKVPPGPIGVGTKFRSVMSGTGLLAQTTVEYVEFERPRRISERTHLSNMEVTGGLDFEAEAGASGCVGSGIWNRTVGTGGWDLWSGASEIAKSGRSGTDSSEFWSKHRPSLPPKPRWSRQRRARRWFK